MNQNLISELAKLPSTWLLTPVKDKKPLRDDWQTEQLTVDELIEQLKNGYQTKSKKTGHPYTIKWDGYGLRLGNVSGGLVALDVDGSSAQPILDAMSKGDLPPTVSWTSNRVGRYQLLYQLPVEIQYQLSDFTKKDIKEFEGIKTGLGDDGNREQLEFRYNRVQSVLPPSSHPQTGSYVWINSPESTHVAEAPKWLCDALLGFAAKPMKAKPAKKEFAKSDTSERDLVIAALNYIDSDVGYSEFLNVLMALHSYDVDLLDAAIDWASGAKLDDHQYRTASEVTYKWQSFKTSGSIQIGTLFFYAVEAGFKYPANLSSDLTQWVKSQVSSHTANQKTSFTPFVKRSLVLEDLEEIDFEEALEQSKKTARHKDAWQFVRNRFPRDIAENIDFFSSRTGIKPEIYALSFLTALSSVLNGKFSVECYKPTKWYEPLNIFFVAIGEPGTNKSSPLKLMTNYHVKKNAEYRAKFAEDKKQFDFDKSEYDLTKKDKIAVGELPPDAPVERFSSIGQATMEALIHVMQSQLHTYKTGLLQYQDELMTILGSLNKYNGGGDDVARLLEIFSGSEVTGLTLGRGSTGTDKACLSIMATTQPDSWVEIMSKLSKRNGFEDRFLVGEILNSDSKKINHLDHSEAEYDFDDFIKRYVDLFENLDSNQVIKVSHSADQMKNSIEDWYIGDSTGLAKSKSYIYRIAGILACMRNPNKPEILSEDLDVGWKFVCYSNACKASICATGNMTLGEELVNRAKQLFIKKGELTVSNLKQSNRTMFGSLTKEELHGIIQRVGSLCADTSELTTTKQGSPKLVHIEAKAVVKLEKDFAKVIEPKPVTPIVEPIVELEPIVDQPNVDKPVEAELECIHTNQLVQIDLRDLPASLNGKVDESSQFELVKDNGTRLTLKILGTGTQFYVKKDKAIIV